MQSLNRSRCPHFQIYTESLELDGPPAYLAVRRCLLTERLNRLLEISDEGKLLAEKLVIRMNDGRQFAFVGPDLEAVSQATCSVSRCETRCTPSYHQNLLAFDIADPQEQEVTCNEQEEARETVRESAESVNAVSIPTCA